MYRFRWLFAGAIIVATGCSIDHQQVVEPVSIQNGNVAPPKSASEKQHAVNSATGQRDIGYSVYQSIALDPQESGTSGFLQILQDERVTPKYREAWGVTNEPQMALAENDPLLKSIKLSPLRNGRVQLTSADGHVLADEPIDVPLGKIETEFLYGTKFPTYLVSIDEGIGMGSYAGPATMLAEVRDGKLQFVHLADKKEGQSDRIWLGRSLKNGWQIVGASDGVGKEIEQINCHPNFANPKWADTGEFVVTYSTYRFVGDQWHRVSREEIGFWENEGDWPNRSQFP